MFSPALTTTEALAPYLAHLEAGKRRVPAGARRAGDRGAARRTRRRWLKGAGTTPALASRPARAGLSRRARCGRRRRAVRERAGAALEIRRGAGPAARATLDARAVAEHLRRLADHVGAVDVTEFLVTKIDAIAEVRARARRAPVARPKRPLPTSSAHRNTCRDRRPVAERRARLVRRHVAHGLARERPEAGRSSGGRPGRMW